MRVRYSRSARNSQKAPVPGHASRADPPDRVRSHRSLILEPGEPPEWDAAITSAPVTILFILSGTKRDVPPIENTVEAEHA